VHAKALSLGNSKYLSLDNVVLVISFEDGSLGSVTYTALGSKTASRERIEVYGNASVGVLEDFRTLELIRGSRRNRIRTWAQEMGYAGELKTFCSIPPDSYKPIFTEAILTTKTTFAAMQSLDEGRPVSIKDARWNP
jgi:predicted dehydrogenase